LWSYAIAGALGSFPIAAAVVAMLRFLVGFRCEDDLQLPAVCDISVIGIVEVIGANIVVGTVTAVFCWLIRRPDLDRAGLPSPQSAVTA
jgi:hypothetical protein